MNRTIFDYLAGCRRLRLVVRLERTASSLSIHKDKDISYICGSKWKCVKIVRKDLVVPVRNSHSRGERGDPKIIWNSVWNSTISIFEQSFSTYWVRRVNAALVTDAGRLRPLMISRQIFLFITWQKKIKNTMNYFVPQWAEQHKKFWNNFSPLTSTSPPFSTTSLNSLNKSNVCFAIIGTLLTGVPENKTKSITKRLQTPFSH